MSLTAENRFIYKRILVFLKPYLKKISIIFVCIIVSTCINMLLPLLSKQIMDNGLLVKNFGIVVKFSLLTLAIV